MARGLVIGQVFDPAGNPLTNTQVALTAIRGADSNGILVNFSVPLIKITAGIFPFQVSRQIEQRLTNDAGVFVIPFSWDSANPDNLARVAGVDVLQIKVTILKDDNTNKSFVGDGFKVPDAIQFLDNIKAGQLLQSGSFQAIFDKLKPEFENAITGKEFQGIPFTMLSTDQVAILGLLPDLSF